MSCHTAGHKNSTDQGCYIIQLWLYPSEIKIELHKNSVDATITMPYFKAFHVCIFLSSEVGCNVKKLFFVLDFQ